MPVIFCDFETQSAVDLRKLGVKEYISHPTTRVMSAVFMRDGGKPVTWVPKGVNIPSDANRLCSLQSGSIPVSVIPEGSTIVAHNAEMFDEIVWDRLVKYDGAKTTLNWIDTIHLARLAGRPAGLDALSQSLGFESKSDSSAMMLLTKAIVRNGNVVYPTGSVSVWEKMLKYNVKDVELLRSVYHALLNELGDSYTQFEKDIQQLHCIINARGFRIDVDRCRHYRQLWRDIREEATDEISRLTGGIITEENINSPQQVKRWLETVGLHTNTLNKQYVQQIIDSPDNYITSDGEAEKAIAVLMLRRNAVRNAGSKLDKLIAESGRGVCSHQIVYHKAHTGRFAGRGSQPHNFPRDIDGMYDIPLHPTVEQLAIGTSDIRKSDILAALTRTVVIPREGYAFSKYDYAAIEARGIAWISGETSLLKQFENNEDVYCIMASKLFGRKIAKEDKRERFLGKTIILGCGYQMGEERFGAQVKQYGIDLATVGVTAKQCIESYRKTYSKVSAIWKRLNECAIVCVETGKEMRAGKCRFQLLQTANGGNALSIVLPSGRALRYHDARVVERPAPWNKFVMLKQVEYTGQFGFPRWLYGGIIAENIVQAICRDILCNAMLHISGMLDCNIVLHVHDSILAEIPKATRLAKSRHKRIGELMSTLPDWADGFPVSVAGEIGDRY